MGFRTNLHDTITSQGPVSERCCTGDQTSNAQVFLKDTPDSNHNSYWAMQQWFLTRTVAPMFVPYTP